MSATKPTLTIAAVVLFVGVWSEFFARSAADNPPDCPYPCLPPPASWGSLSPPQPPSDGSLPYPPPPPQPYTPGYLPPPYGYVPGYVPPGFGYVAPPPPNAIMPYFPYYFRKSNSATRPEGCRPGLPLVLLHAFLVCFLLLLFTY